MKTPSVGREEMGCAEKEEASWVARRGGVGWRSLWLTVTPVAPSILDAWL